MSLEALQVDTVKKTVTRIEECLAQAGAYYKRTFWLHEVKFDLTGQAAGMFCVRNESRQYIRINRTLLDANPAEMFNQVIPHEVAHLVAYQIHGRLKAHGPEWQAIMRNCFNLEPDRCHTLDTSLSSTNPYAYRCACLTHKVSKRIHNQIVRRPGSRICAKCKVGLKFSHVQEVEAPVLIMDVLFVSAGTTALLDSDVAKVVTIVGKHRVRKLILGPGCTSSTNADNLRKKLGVAKEACWVHENEKTLPGALTHAVLIASVDNGYSARAAAVLRSKGLTVRVLSRGGD